MKTPVVKVTLGWGDVEPLLEKISRHPLGSVWRESATIREAFISVASLLALRMFLACVRWSA